MVHNRYRSTTVKVLAVLVAVIYNSWVLGYLLNPKMAGVGSASNLEAAGQPYNWLFVSGDVVCGLMIIVISLLVLKEKNKWLYLSVFGLVVFGLMTIASALIPLNCSVNATSCAYSDIFGWHDLTGEIGALALFMAMVYATALAKGRSYYNWYVASLAAWSVVGLCFVLVALPAVINSSHLVAFLATWQDAFLILSGLLVYLSAYSYLEYREAKTPSNI